MLQFICTLSDPHVCVLTHRHPCSPPATVAPPQAPVIGPHGGFMTHDGQVEVVDTGTYVRGSYVRTKAKSLRPPDVESMVWSVIGAPAQNLMRWRYLNFGDSHFDGTTPAPAMPVRSKELIH